MKRTAGIVRGRRQRGLETVVVVSAMAKVTDLLLSAASAAGRGDKAGALAIGARLRHRHIDTSMALLEAERFTRLQQILHQEFDTGRSAARIAAVGELTPRTNDLVLSFGETFQQDHCRSFESRGCKALTSMRSCIVTAGYGKARRRSAIEAKLLQSCCRSLMLEKTPVLEVFIGRRKASRRSERKEATTRPLW